jgi:hypothetical protein
MSLRNLLFIVVGLIIGLIGSTQFPLHAQQRPRAVEVTPEHAAVPPSAKVSLQDALHRPYAFAFGKGTTLAEVARRLTADLGGQVVLDIAALERLDIKPEAGLELELTGVRLKTGLKLLLDQVGLTYRLVPEDDLLILTDREGSDDPLDKVWAELSHLHNDVHEVQDLVEDLYDLSYRALDELDKEGGPRLRQPTILEEMPEGGPKPEAQPEAEGPIPTNPPKRPRTRL